MRPRRHALAVFASAGLALWLTACQPTSPQEAEGGTGAGLGPFSDAVPADHDWHLTLHGGSGDLTFGDGDWAEGEHLLQLSCMPRSGEAEITWPGEGEAVLTAGTATETLAHAGRISTRHPVLAALKDTGAISVGRGETDLRLTAETAGRRELADFFAYCDEGREPGTTPEAPPPSETPPTAEAETEAAPATPAGPVAAPTVTPDPAAAPVPTASTPPVDPVQPAAAAEGV